MQSNNSYRAICASSSSTSVPSSSSNCSAASRRLGQRYPGDMTHRPLEMLRREAEAAEEATRSRAGVRDVDVIDMLDTTSATILHHGGPYDAALFSRNLVEKYSPMAAVRDSNMEAIRATPRDYIIDCLERHIPLQGTATIPSGGYDLGGNLVKYEEGTDPMQDPELAGKSHKRRDNTEARPNEDLEGEEGENAEGAATPPKAGRLSGLKRRFAWLARKATWVH